MNAIKGAIEALELAFILEISSLPGSVCMDAASELRRQHAEIDELRAALAALRSMPEAVPVAWQVRSFYEGEGWMDWRHVDVENLPLWRRRTLKFPDRFEMRPLYTTPPPAPVLLSDAEIDAVYREVWSTVTHSKRLSAFARAIEQAIGRASREASK